MIKKERIAGMEVTRALTPLQNLTELLGIKEQELRSPNILKGTQAYRDYVLQRKTKKVVWQPVTKPKEKIRR